MWAPLGCGGATVGWGRWGGHTAWLGASGDRRSTGGADSLALCQMLCGRGGATFVLQSWGRCCIPWQSPSGAAFEEVCSHRRMVDNSACTRAFLERVRNMSSCNMCRGGVCCSAMFFRWCARSLDRVNTIAARPLNATGLATQVQSQQPETCAIW